MATHRQAVSEARQANATRFEELSQIENGSFALHIRVGGTDNLTHPSLVHPRYQRINFQLLRANAIERREGPMST